MTERSKPKEYVYEAAGKGACCSAIHIRLKGDVIQRVEFVNGCPGNHRGIEALVRGQKAGEVIERLMGLRCGSNLTSCPDQLAKALQAALKARQGNEERKV
jgi:uncharacterized protein (TIGR03905 family)